MKIGILGPRGTFSEVAYNKYQNESDDVVPYYFQSLEETTESLKNMDKIIVPLENTLEGYVQQILDFLILNDAYIEKEIYVDVQFDLVSKVPFDQIKNIFVQFAAKGQCQNYLKTLSNVDLTLTSSNTQSLEMFQKGDLGDAAIIPAHLTNAEMIFKNVTDSIHNQTRFIVVSKHLLKYRDNQLNVSLVVVPINDRPGLLYDILSVFKSQKINLTSIMSRPQKNYMGKYNFYIEFLSNQNIYQEIEALLKATKDEYTIKILGIYPKEII